MTPPADRQASLTRRLVMGVLAALLLVWAGFFAFGHRTGIHEAGELTDGHLAGTAALLLTLDLPPFIESPLEPNRQANLNMVRPALASLKHHDYQFSLSVVVRDAAGHVLARSGEAPLPPFVPRDGFADLLLGTPAAAWRSFSQWDATRSRQVTVLVKFEEREALAEDVAAQLAEPVLWLLPVVALALGAAILRGLRPLQALSRDVEAMEVDKAARLQARHPYRELNSVVRSINRLVGQQQAALERERQLASEIAHELRTPLSSIALQAASLRGALPAQAQAAALQQISADALRAGHVISQLLALARTGQAVMLQALVPLDLATLAREVVAGYAQAAWQSGHRLSVQGVEHQTVRAHPLLLELALRNLIDNALQHTARGTAVCVQWGSEAGHAWLQVCDDGQRSHDAPAIALASTDRLGLGHKIVGRVMDIHGGSFAQHAAAAPFNRCYRLCFPAVS
ncbi:HAMP domain-containing sensor histidine kinase [Polaromonas sp. CG_9.11]|uniref:sensor histidine kinase n=1 Tax=Polaromonas sp. CG_9.11 TaxID=2787730 RepID=UPI0018CBB2BC|nr:histidine kinase dimerization/phospho-acceptor domain-containing protein [Polaromonas sp. CG_9.11]MBG6076829.1 two-component system sensor histidine kinase QseC [Polaromonas sp. CG_9.11]